MKKKLKKMVKPLEKWKESKVAERLPANIETLLAHIIQEDKFTLDDIFNLSDVERKKIEVVLTAGYLTLAGDDRERFSINTEEIISQSSRNEIWERNHQCILNIISWQTNSQGRIPTIKEIADESELSRVTVGKHLKDYYDSDAFKEKANMYKFLREKLLIKVYGFAYEGNMRAAKIFMEATSSLNDPDIKIQNQQNNFIQINGKTISKEQLSQLPIDKQRQINEILDLVYR